MYIRRRRRETFKCSLTLFVNLHIEIQGPDVLLSIKNRIQLSFKFIPKPLKLITAKIQWRIRRVLTLDI